MSKIDRYNGNVKAFASEATGTERTIFGDTAQSDTLDANITLDLLRGWGVIGVESNPTKQHFNGLGFTLGQLIAYLHQQGVPEWNAAQEYYAGSVVTTLAGIYRLKSGGDGSYDPDTEGGVNWELAPTRAQVDAKADQATTYTETEVDDLLDDKAAISGQTFSGNISAPNLSGTNTGDQDLSAKADQDTTYTKTEVDDLLDDKAAISGQTFSGDISATNLSGTNTGDQVLSEIGVGQTWQDVSRLSEVTYTNNTGKPIAISGYYFQAVGGNKLIQIIVGSVTVARADSDDVNDNQVFAIIPSGNTYVVSVSGATGYWRELR